MGPSVDGRSGDSFEVRSTDGTTLRVWVMGSGPPIVLVHGSFTDHSAWDVPGMQLAEHFTTYAVDRRGFGASGDAPVYSIDREFEDVAAVVDAVAAMAGADVILWGHSYGANCAMGGASLSRSVQDLILYEPSLGLQYPAGVIEGAETALAEGDRDTIVRRMLFDILDMSPLEIEAVRSSPRWPVVLAGAHTAPREARAEQGWVYRPGQFDGIRASTLLLSGSDSPAPVISATSQAAAAVPGSRVHVLDGHGHFAHRTHPQMVVALISDFVDRAGRAQ